MERIVFNIFDEAIHIPLKFLISIQLQVSTLMVEMWIINKINTNEILFTNPWYAVAYVTYSVQ